MNAFTKWLYGKSTEKCQKEADSIYQIQEFEGDIWLTFNGALICPERLLQGDPVCTLNEIRRLYVKRNATDYDKGTNTASV